MRALHLPLGQDRDEGARHAILSDPEHGKAKQCFFPLSCTALHASCAARITGHKQIPMTELQSTEQAIHTGRPASFFVQFLSSRAQLGIV
jgi:hypothetical protein